MKKNICNIFGRRNKQSGILLVEAIVFGSIAIVMIGALISWAAVNIKASRLALEREQAMLIAEAGEDYYRWHLAHASGDYKDGNATSTGPYVHQFYDKDGNDIGAFTLTITPPITGSTLVTIVSRGTIVADPTVHRTLKVQLGIPSLAKYAMVTNAVVYYGCGDEVFGPIHSNVGVGFFACGSGAQPIAHNVVTSAVSTFNDGSNHFGVYTSVSPADPTPPASVPNRPDVFVSGRQFPVPAVDFSSITSDLSAIKANAQASGFYRAASGGQGYKVVLKTNDTFDLYKVNSLLSTPGGCTNSQGQTGWGTWSIKNDVPNGAPTGGAATLLGNYPFPANGLMFFEDHVWIEGQINSARLTIAAGAFPVNSATYKNIIVNNNLIYTNFDGTDAIGLIAQGNFLVGMASAANLTIDGAIIAQNGKTIRYYYNGCGASYDLRTSLTTYGMFASNGQGYFYYSGGGNSGYASQPASYDGNFLFGPPPSFPLTSSSYQIISWGEIP